MDSFLPNLNYTGNLWSTLKKVANVEGWQVSKNDKLWNATLDAVSSVSYEHNSLGINR